MRWIRRWLTKSLVPIFGVEDHREIVLTAVTCRGDLYIITDCHVYRYDPDRDLIRAQANI